MGRGDKKTAKGKRFKGSFGKTRLARSAKKTITTTGTTVAAPVEKVVKVKKTITKAVK